MLKTLLRKRRKIPEEIPGVNCQERTYDELIESLKEALQEMIEFNKQEAKAAAESDYQEDLISI